MGDFITWLAEEISQIFKGILNSVIDGFTYLIGLIPAPDFLLNMGSYTVPSNVSFYTNLFEFQYGLTVVTAAYIARFILRRIPGIG